MQKFLDKHIYIYNFCETFYKKSGKVVLSVESKRFYKNSVVGGVVNGASL